MIIHNELKAFICDVCGKTYRTKAILKRHLNVHEGKIYECDQCDKTFPYYARLRIHRYSHRTELNYICQVCSKAFKVQKYLARHMKVHKEEKAYPCKYCGKRFTFSTGRRAHEISQHNAIWNFMIGSFVLGRFIKGEKFYGIESFHYSFHHMKIDEICVSKLVSELWKLFTAWRSSSFNEKARTLVCLTYPTFLFPSRYTNVPVKRSNVWQKKNSHV